MKRFVKRLLRRIGVDVRRYTPLNCTDLRRAHFMKHHRVDTVLDVGANVGQYAAGLRQQGFTGRIISFEPQSRAFAQLCKRAKGDPRWSCRNVALGAERARCVLNVTRNSVSSSLLPQTEYMAAAFAGTALIEQEVVAVDTLDMLLGHELRLGECQVLLKIDAQGYERHVLDGAHSMLPGVALLELELALTPMYEGGSTFPEMFTYLSNCQFRLVSLEPNTVDPQTDYIVEVNALFVRTSNA